MNSSNAVSGATSIIRRSSIIHRHWVQAHRGQHGLGGISRVFDSASGLVDAQHGTPAACSDCQQARPRPAQDHARDHRQDVRSHIDTRGSIQCQLNSTKAAPASQVPRLTDSGQRCKQALSMWKLGIRSHRGVKLKGLLAVATEYTGKSYKGKQHLDHAIADLSTLLEARSFDQIGDTRQVNKLVGGPAADLDGSV